MQGWEQCQRESQALEERKRLYCAEIEAIGRERAEVQQQQEDMWRREEEHQQNMWRREEELNRRNEETEERLAQMCHDFDIQQAKIMVCYKHFLSVRLRR